MSDGSQAPNEPVLDTDDTEDTPRKMFFFRHKGDKDLKMGVEIVSAYTLAEAHRKFLERHPDESLNNIEEW